MYTKNVQRALESQNVFEKKTMRNKIKNKKQKD